MTHTAELHTPITAGEYESLIAYNGGQWEKDKKGKTRYHIRTLRGYGITDIQPRKHTAQYIYYYCSIIINLHRIAHERDHGIETYNNENDFVNLSTNFAKYISAILPSHTDINSWNVFRIDYNIDLKLSPNKVDQYIILLQRGGKHYSWAARENVKGNHIHPYGSVLYSNKSYSVNIYDKHRERLQDQAERGIIDLNELNESSGVLRIEIQVKRAKINALKKHIKADFDSATAPIMHFARYSVAVPLILKVLSEICGTTDYTTLCNALKRLKSVLRPSRALVDTELFLRLVGRFRSLWKAAEAYNGETSIKTIMKHLDALNINPVTIPTAFKVSHLDNLIHLVTEQFSKQIEEQTKGDISL